MTEQSEENYREISEKYNKYSLCSQTGTLSTVKRKYPKNLTIVE